MKRNLLIIALVLFFSQLLSAQQQTVNVDFSVMTKSRNISTFSNSLFLRDSAFTPDYYMQKSRVQKTTAWVMLGTGVGIFIIGAVGATNNVFVDENATNTYGVVALLGAGLALGSIPVFIASGHNARKAATLSLKNQNILFPQQNSFVRRSQPTISIDIPL